MQAQPHYEKQAERLRSIHLAIVITSLLVIIGTFLSSGSAVRHALEQLEQIEEITLQPELLIRALEQEIRPPSREVSPEPQLVDLRFDPPLDFGSGLPGHDVNQKVLLAGLRAFNGTSQPTIFTRSDRQPAATQRCEKPAPLTAPEFDTLASFMQWWDEIANLTAVYVPSLSPPTEEFKVRFLAADTSSEATSISRVAWLGKANEMETGNAVIVATDHVQALRQVELVCLRAGVSQSAEIRYKLAFSLGRSADDNVEKMYRTHYEVLSEEEKKGMSFEGGLAKLGFIEVPSTIESVPLRGRQTLLTRLPAAEGDLSFELAFPALAAITRGFEDVDLERLPLYVQDKGERSAEVFSFYGTSISVEHIATWGLIIVLFEQIYFALHLHGVHRNAAKIRETGIPWLGIYDDLISRSVTLITVFALPILAFSATAFLVLGDRAIGNIPLLESSIILFENFVPLFVGLFIFPISVWSIMLLKEFWRLSSKSSAT